jgi:hypothetical protein
VSFFGSQDLSEADKIPDDEERVLDKLAERVVRWKMAVPAIVFLESVKPLNYIGAQTMVFFEPIVQTIFNFKDYDTFRRAMERRENVERLLQKIESADADESKREREYRRRLKKARKESKSWLVKLRLRTPKVEMPPREPAGGARGPGSAEPPKRS